MYVDVGLSYEVVNNGFEIINHMIWDSSDNSIEYLTEKEYSLIKSLLDNSGFHPKFDCTILAKLALTGGSYELFNDGRIAVCISYLSDSWVIYFCIVNEGNLRYARAGINFSDDISFDVVQDYVCCMRISEIYAAYLVVDESARNREINKILDLLHFRYRDRLNNLHVVVGYNNILI